MLEKGVSQFTEFIKHHAAYASFDISVKMKSNALFFFEEEKIQNPLTETDDFFFSRSNMLI